MVFALEANVHKNTLSDCYCTMNAMTDRNYTLKLLQKLLRLN